MFFCRYLVQDFVKLTSKLQQYRWDTLYKDFVKTSHSFFFHRVYIITIEWAYSTSKVSKIIAATQNKENFWNPTKEALRLGIIVIFAFLCWKSILVTTLGVVAQRCHNVQFSLVGFQNLFLLWVAEINLEAKDAELERAHSSAIIPYVNITVFNNSDKR